jgi:hypothetical protein
MRSGGLRPAQQGGQVHKTPSQPVAGHSGTCLSSKITQEAEIGKMAEFKVPGQPNNNKKSLETSNSIEKHWLRWHTPVIPALVDSTK